MKLTNVTSSLIITVIVIFTLIYAKPIIVPLVIALLIWFVVKKTRDLIDRIPFIHKYVPQFVKTVLVSVLIFFLFLEIVRMLIANIEELAASYKVYNANIESVALQINDLFGIELKKEINHWLSSVDVAGSLNGLGSSLSDIFGNTLFIVFYTVFLFLEETVFQDKVKLIFKGKDDSYARFIEIESKIDKSLSRYISMKSLISLMKTVLSFIVFKVLGLEAAVFWAFLIFMLNFIPSVGSIIATILPALFALLQFGVFTPFLIILVLVGSIQILIGNLVEPKLMGNTLNISPLVAILSLAVWGAIWGITGMLLSVPITVALIIVFSQFPSTRPIAILLSEKGRV